MLGNLSIIMPYIKKNRKHFILYCVLNFITWSIAFIIPYLTGCYIDGLLYSSQKIIVFMFTGVVISVNIVNIVGSYCLNLTTAKLNTNMAFQLSYDVYEHLKKVPYSYLRNTDKVYLVSKINDDANAIVSFFLTNCLAIFTQGIAFAVGFLILANIDILLSIILLFFIPLYIVIYIKYRKRVYDASFQLKESQNKYFSKMMEQFNLIKFVKVNSLYDFFSSRLKSAYGSLFKDLIKSCRVTYLFKNISMILSLFVNIIIIFYAGMEVIDKKMTIGNFTIIGTYFTSIINSVNYYMELGTTYQSLLVSVKRMNELTNIKKEENGKIQIETIESIDLKDVSFSYDNSKELIKGFNYHFEKGKIYCLKGDNGCGKSSLIDLILGINQEYVGVILYNNINIRDLGLPEVRGMNFAVVEQEPLLINSSIKENILLDGKKEITADIFTYCKKLNIDQKIKSLEGVLEYNISEDSQNMSGGEKQKISLLRAFGKDSSVLVLDEPTSALDEKSILGFLEILMEIKKNKIIIIVSHKDTVIDFVDEVIRL